MHAKNGVQLWDSRQQSLQCSLVAGIQKVTRRTQNPPLEPLPYRQALLEQVPQGLPGATQTRVLDTTQHFSSLIKWNGLSSKNNKTPSRNKWHQQLLLSAWRGEKKKEKPVASFDGFRRSFIDTRCLFIIFFFPFCQQLAIPSSGLHVSWRQAVHLTTAHLPEKSRKREKMHFKEHSRSFVVPFLSFFLRTYLYLFRSIRTRRTCGDEHSLSTPDPKNNLRCAFHWWYEQQRLNNHPDVIASQRLRSRRNCGTWSLLYVASFGDTRRIKRRAELF